MNLKILEDSSYRLSIKVNYQHDRNISIILIGVGTLLTALAFLRLLPDFISSTLELPKNLSITLGYIISALFLGYGIFRLFTLPQESVITLDKAVGKLFIEHKKILDSQSQDYPLQEATGVESLVINSNGINVLSSGKPSINFIAWLKKTVKLEVNRLFS